MDDGQGGAGTELPPMPIRFEGSPDTMQGGYLAGVASTGLPMPTRVQIRRPVRPGDVLRFHELPNERRLTAEGALVLKAFPDVLRVEDPIPVASTEIVQVMAKPRPFAKPFPMCAGCGDRADGLGVDLRPLGRRMLGTWTPVAEESPSPSDSTSASSAIAGGVPTPHIWTVIDCLTSWSLFADPPGERSGHFVTGNIAAEFRRPIEAGRTYWLQSWRDRDGDVGTFRNGSIIVGGSIEDEDGIVALADQELVRTDGVGMDLASVLADMEED